MIVDRASVTFEGLTLSAERAQAIARRAFALAAASSGDLAGRVVERLVLDPVEVGPGPLDDDALARRIAAALHDQLRQRNRG
jgi:hypothetical protein